MEIREALTFDDVLLVPGASAVLPSQADTRTLVTQAVFWTSFGLAARTGRTP